MALTGNTVQSTYLDLVQLEKSGAGLPAHAGKEAAVYDGSGAQILGRSAVRHWLDPHPDAASFAETWEFSTTGNMTQGQLETAGWVFEECTGVVSGGQLVLTATSTNILKAYYPTTLAGDFDIAITVSCPVSYITSCTDLSSNAYHIGGGGVADYRLGTSDLAHYGLCQSYRGTGGFNRLITGAFTTLGGTAETDTVPCCNIVRCYRYSGTLEVCGGSSFGPTFFIADSPNPDFDGFTQSGNVACANTVNYIFLAVDLGGSTNGAKYAFQSIRRFQ